MDNDSQRPGSAKRRQLPLTAEIAANQPHTSRAKRKSAAVAHKRRKRIVTSVVSVAALVLLAIGAVVYQSGESNGPPDSARLPAPRDEPEVALDVNSLVGQPAPSFTLADSEGNSYTVTPGGDRPIALITHMGIT